MELVKTAINFKQRALIGKVSMNVKNNSGYYNDTDKEVDETEKFVEEVRALEVSYFDIIRVLVFS